MILREGQELLKTYTVERFLGAGAFAEVYRVRHRFMGRQAMKLLKNPNMTEEEINDVLSEARLLSKLNHRNIVRVFDAGIIQGEIGSFGYFTMEYLPEGTLYDYWQSQQSYMLPVTTSMEIISQICCALAVAHSGQPPIIHRDIKPHNILVGYESDGAIRVCLSDFGLAKQVSSAELIASGKGTIGFKPPEFFVNKTDNMASDVWAVGTTAYHLLASRFPFSLCDEDWFARQKWEEGYVPPSHYNANVSPEIDRIIGRCLAVDPFLRYPSAVELQRDIAATFTSTSNCNSAKVILLNDKELLECPQEEIDRVMALVDNNLSEAAAELATLCKKYPEIKERFSYRLDLWQRGIKM